MSYFYLRIINIDPSTSVSMFIRVTSTQSTLMIARNMCLILIILRDRIIAFAIENQEVIVKLLRSCSLVSISLLKRLV